MDLKKVIRSVPDFPKPGINFKDITTILLNPDAVQFTLDSFLKLLEGKKIDKVAAIESRGFIFGAMIANKLGVGFVPIRKPNKLPAEKITETYALEYGTDTIEIHKDAISYGEKILLHDDLLATGGTARAACSLIEKLGGAIEQVSFIIELNFLNGREALKNYDVKSLVSFDGE